MVQYDFLMANFLAAIMFLLIMSNFGAADDIYGDDYIVINSAENPNALNSDYDFDMDSIRFTPEYQTTRVQSTSLSEDELIYSENINFSDSSGRLYSENGSEAYAYYDVTARDDFLYLPYNDGAFFQDNVVITASEQVPPNNTREGVSSITYVEYRDASPIGINLTQWSTLGISIRGDNSYVDVSGGTVATTEGALDAIGTTLNNATRAVVEVPRMIGGYITFAATVPGLLGTILRLYLGVLLTILLVDLIWVG